MSVENNEEWFSCVHDVIDAADELMRWEDSACVPLHVPQSKYNDAVNRLIVVTDTLLDESYCRGKRDVIAII